MPQLTREQVSEIIKCRNDFFYFCSNYLQITHPAYGLIPFELYDFQKRVITEYSENKFCIVKKFRQAGLTTVTAMWMLWKCMFFNDQRILIVSKTDREARAVGKTVAAAKHNLPDWIKPEMNNDNDHEKEFAETRSNLYFFTPSAARSRSLTHLVIDEAAFVVNMEEHWKSMYPTLSTGGSAIIISTANGVGGIGAWYYEQYKKALAKQSLFHIVSLHWKEHPDYNKPGWEEKTKANIGLKSFEQEYESSFASTGQTYIPSEIINEYEKTCIPPIKKMIPEWDQAPVKDFDADNTVNNEYELGALWIWELPKPGKEYILSADAGEGQGENNDNSAFIVMETSTLTQVAEFYSNTIPKYKFAQVISQTGKMYNGCQVVVENSMGPGTALIERLEQDFQYDNLYYGENKTGTNRAGINTNKTIRPLCMDTLQTCMLSKIVKVRSTRVIKELLTFIFNQSRNRAEAQRGKHDDLVICLAVALYVASCQNKGLPIGAKQSDDIITKTITDNLSFTDIWKELENDINSEKEFVFGWDEDMALLPFSTKSDFIRPNDKILKEWGM